MLALQKQLKNLEHWSLSLQTGHNKEDVDIFFDSRLCIPQRAKRLREAILDIHQLDLCLLIVDYEDHRKNLHMIHNVKLLPTLYPKLFPLRSFQLVRVASNVFTLSLFCTTIHKLVLIWVTFELFKNAYFNWIRYHFNQYNKAYFTKQKQMAAFKKQFLSQDCQVQLRLYKQRFWHLFWRINARLDKYKHINMYLYVCIYIYIFFQANQKKKS
ncbi:hypothetical protein RFI_14932 [Reticulomyxa filosa]|uniref:Uncharacterized protein n=1 Tax=Reticulomyxa filosa TaxID=46433 RepID=X6N8N1_RETFI|nr:hypothetical protein RFI_14932 [Reticulomyxa filosa]|eukprot:ETO22268.1 hypothetical protein RFI_14932 [Reticulomyxa filosa]